MCVVMFLCIQINQIARIICSTHCFGYNMMLFLIVVLIFFVFSIIKYSLNIIIILFVFIGKYNLYNSHLLFINYKTKQIFLSNNFVHIGTLLPIQFSYELLILSYKLRLYLHPILNNRGYPLPYACMYSPQEGQSLNFLTICKFFYKLSQLSC